MKPSPVIIESTQPTSNGDRLLAELETLNSPVLYKIQAKGMADISIPEEYMPLILNNARILESQVQRSKINAQFNYGNPDGKYPFLKATDTIPKRFYVDGTDIKEEGTPFLEWVAEVQEDTRRKIEYKASGWRVVLSGATESTFLFIPWDNLDGLDKAINDLPRKDSITAMMSLKNPEATKKLASRKAFLDLKSAKNLPAVKMTALRKMIIENNLHTDLTDYHWKTGHLTSLFVQVGEVRIPLAIRVDPSTRAAWRRKLTPKENELPYAAKQALTNKIDKEYSEEWWKRFKAALAKDLPDWYQVSIPNRDWQNGRNNEPEGYWITRIPRKTWEIVAPAAQDAARHTSFRGSSF